jgi:hypothetical protein
MKEFKREQKIKNIALSEKAYTLLSKRGKKGETFNKIVLKLLGEREENGL